MATEPLVEMLREQLVAQRRLQEDMERRHEEWSQCHEEQMQALLALFERQEKGYETSSPPSTALSAFMSFDPSAALWRDYWSRFSTYVEAHAVPGERVAHVFLTNQSPVVYKVIANLASQRSLPVDNNKLSFMEIHDHMMDQFHPKRFVV